MKIKVRTEKILVSLLVKKLLIIKINKKLEKIV